MVKSSHWFLVIVSKISDFVSFANCFQLGDLTPNGFKTEKDFGARLSAWYPSFFADKPAAHLISPNESRCIETAVAILDGLSIEEYTQELLEMITLDPNNVTSLIPLIEQANKTVLPPCVEAVLSNASLGIDLDLPKNVTDILKLLFKYQLTDTIDTLVQSGYTGNALGINLGTCVPPGMKLMTEEAFAVLTDLCRPSQCVSIISRVMADVQSFADENSPPRSMTRTASVYGLTDVHVLDLLQSLLPQFNHTRPQFGGFILLEVRGDDITILTGQDVLSEPQERVTLNIYEVLQLLRVRMNLAA